MKAPISKFILIGAVGVHTFVCLAGSINPPTKQDTAGTTSAVGSTAALVPFFQVAAARQPSVGKSTPSPGEYEQPRVFKSITRTNSVGKKPLTDRAFFGAPPVIVHRGIVTQGRGNNCLQCHAKENRIEHRHQAIAPVPHAEYTQCTQCHVKGDPEAKPFGKGNQFVGLDFPGKGSRAYPTAPPTVPHKNFMRENCMTCHGPTGNWRIKTSHPYRTQCTQCHVPEAKQDYTRPQQQVH